MSALVRWAPPIIADVARRALGRTIYFERANGAWADALMASSGYDGEKILKHVINAARIVKSGKAAFERDGVLFKERAIAFQLAAPLLRHALKHEGHLDVVDFGGALGGTFRQLRWFLSSLRSLRWRVVEQSHFVAAGRAEFETDELSFHESLSELPVATTPRLVLLSSVLQYLPSPYETFASLSCIGASTMVIDRTPFADMEQDRLCIQHVPVQIYKASYPCWIFSSPRFKERRLTAGWSEALRFPSAEGAYRMRGGGAFNFEGRILELDQ